MQGEFPFLCFYFYEQRVTDLQKTDHMASKYLKMLGKKQMIGKTKEGRGGRGGVKGGFSSLGSCVTIALKRYHH